MVSFELSKEIKEDVFFFFISSRAWNKKKIQSPNEESNLRPLDSTL